MSETADTKVYVAPQIRTWYALICFAIRALMGIIKTMMPTPASTDGPSTIHSKYRQMHIWNGADQIMLMYVVSSMKRWASTDMRFTISPTVDFFRAALLSRRDCYIQHTNTFICYKGIMTEKKIYMYIIIMISESSDFVALYKLVFNSVQQAAGITDIPSSHCPP